MNFDDLIPEEEDPVTGKGKEMVPDRGLPFEGQIDESLPEVHGEGFSSVPLTSAEIDDLMNEGRPADPRDSGMGAGFPAEVDPTEFEFPDMGNGEIVLPASEIEMVGLAGGFELVRDVPGLNSTWLSTDGTEDLDPAEELLAEYVTKDRLTRLWARIDIAQEDVRTKVPNLDIARKLLDQIEKARNEFLEDIGNYEEVERTLSDVELRIFVTQKSISENRHAMVMFVYEFIWGLAITLGLLAIKVYYPTIDDELGMIIFSAGLGGLGGIVSAMSALWRHTAEEINYSSQYQLWYVINPILGVFLGLVAFLIMMAGIVSLTGEISQDSITFPYVVYLLAFLLGFQQNVAWDLIRRFRNVFLPESDNGNGDYKNG
jgi:hypothetical protein